MRARWSSPPISTSEAARSRRTATAPCCSKSRTAAAKGCWHVQPRRRRPPIRKRRTGIGDGFLLEQGYTLVGWAGSSTCPRDAGLMRLYTPVAKGITGLVRSEIIVDQKDDEPLAGRSGHDGSLSVCGSERSQAGADRARRPRRHAPGGAARASGRSRIGTHVVMPAGFRAGPCLRAGLHVAGSGAGRARSDGHPRHDLVPEVRRERYHRARRSAPYMKRAYGYGASQSGRFLRTFLYYGFNADEKGRKVFDGVLAHVAGAGRGSFNLRFAQPSRDGHPFMNLFYPDRYLPVHRRRRDGSGDGHDGRPADARGKGGAWRRRSSTRIRRMNTGGGQLADPQHAGRQEGRADSGSHAHLFLRRRPARTGRISAQARRHRRTCRIRIRTPTACARCWWR